MRRRTIIIVLSLVILTPLISIGILVMLVKADVFGKLPSEAELKAIETVEASQVYTSDNKLIGSYFIENRSITDSLSQHLVEALIATEDVRFFEHDGVDKRSLLRVIFKTILLGDRSSGGGSTISQQLIKNLYPRNYHGFLSMPVAKIKEAMVASDLEELYSKKEILWLYLNTVPFGEDVMGIEMAARRYFNKASVELKQEEAATLIGMLKGPNLYHPVRNPKRAELRRNVVLHQMMKYEFIAEAKYDSLSAIPLQTDYQPSGRHTGIATHLREQARLWLNDWCSKNYKSDGTAYNLYTDGLKIKLSIDSKAQLAMEKAINANIISLQKRLESEWSGKEPWLNNSFLSTKIKSTKQYKVLKQQGKSEEEITRLLSRKQNMQIWKQGIRVDSNMSVIDSLIWREKKLHAAGVSLDPKSGAILAWVGGEDFSQTPFDYVLAKRQVGSLFKPIVYLNAIRNGASTCDFYSAEQRVFEEYDNWSPSNGKPDSSFYSVWGALANSLNTVSAQLAIDYGLKSIINLADTLGFEGDLPLNPTIALGSASSTPLNMANLYSSFVNGGKRLKPFFIAEIRDPEDQVLFKHQTVSQDLGLHSDNLADLNRMLMLVTDSGTASSLRYRYNIQSEIGSKTGTSQNNADAWFLAMQQSMVSCFWVGANNPRIHFRYTRTGQGAAVALPVYANYYQELRQDNYWRTQLNQPIANKSNVFDCPEKADKQPGFGLFDKISDWFKNDKDSTESDDSTGIFKKIKDWFNKD